MSNKFFSQLVCFTLPFNYLASCGQLAFPVDIDPPRSYIEQARDPLWIKLDEEDQNNPAKCNPPTKIVPIQMAMQAPSDLRKEKAITAGSQLLKCPNCTFNSNKFSQLVRHFARVHDKEAHPFTCNYIVEKDSKYRPCGRKALNYSSARRHLCSHLSIPPQNHTALPEEELKWIITDTAKSQKKRKRWQKIRAHLLRKISKNAMVEYKYSCPNCHSTSQDLYYLAKHWIQEHNSKNCPFICTFNIGDKKNHTSCGKKIVDRSLAYRHIQQHSKNSQWEFPTKNLPKGWFEKWFSKDSDKVACLNHHLENLRKWLSSHTVKA